MLDLFLKIKILEIALPIIIILICTIIIIAAFVRFKINKILKVNCYDCKNYKLHSVDSSGGGVNYKCNVNGKVDRDKIGNKYKLIKCKEFSTK